MEETRKNELSPSKEDIRIVAKVAKVQSKVDTAFNSYKEIMADVYYLSKNKVHKSFGYTDFYKFMRERTGMSKTTAARLISLYQSRLDIKSTLSIECGMDDEQEKKVDEFFDSQPFSKLEEIRKDEGKAINKIAAGMEDGNIEYQFTIEESEDNVDTAQQEKTVRKKYTTIYSGCATIDELLSDSTLNLNINTKYNITIKMEEM